MRALQRDAEPEPSGALAGMLADLAPGDLSRRDLVEALAELDAMAREMETAASVMAETGEHLMARGASAPLDHGQDLSLGVHLLEAASFQDICGQRVAKLKSLIQAMRTRLEPLSTFAPVESRFHQPGEERRKVLILNGPATDVPGLAQTAIDDLFD